MKMFDGPCERAAAGRLSKAVALEIAHEAIGRGSTLDLYAIGSGSPGGSGISKTFSVIDTSM